MSPILHRYFTRELLKVFFLFIFCFFFLYTLLDYTSRLSSLGLNFRELVVMYGCILLRRIEILAPFALLVAGIKVLCQANVRNELVALRGCGLPLQRLLSPLLTVGLAFTALMYLNLQFAVPFAQRQIREIEDTYSGRFKRSSHPVQGLSMNDSQHLIYREYDLHTNKFQQVFWVKSMDDVYRMRSLAPFETPPIGESIQRLIRNADGNLLLAESIPYAEFPDMIFDRAALQETLTPPDDRSLLQLWRRMPKSKTHMTHEQRLVRAAFYRKLAAPLLCLLALLLPAPACTAFRRPLKVFFIYCAAMIALVAIYLAFNAAYTIAQGQSFSPIWTLFLPMLGLLGFGYLRFARMQ